MRVPTPPARHGQRLVGEHFQWTDEYGTCHAFRTAIIAFITNKINNKKEEIYKAENMLKAEPDKQTEREVEGLYDEIDVMKNILKGIESIRCLPVKSRVKAKG